MVSLELISLESLQNTSNYDDVVEQNSSPRISFSSELLDENNFISICPNPQAEKERDDNERAKAARNAAEFEFLSGNLTNMLTADELFREGKLLPFWQMHHSEKLNKISLKSSDINAEDGPKEIKEENRVNWFLDDDPSPRPPKCTVLWKELLRLKKQRASSTVLTPPSISSSSSSCSRTDVPSVDERKEGVRNKDKSVKRIKEKTRTNSIRIRPVINVPICTQAKNNALPPLFSLRKGRLER
ncbi:hypothetical protein DH2020_049020 [Rehmannia glutinosa]|uniref:Uncharacterized protein n=1 Tax=Rehmannia glutinosa TaxID=99300 RepID=A0ABR0U4Z5_REHGL